MFAFVNTSLKFEQLSLYAILKALTLNLFVSLFKELFLDEYTGCPKKLCPVCEAGVEVQYLHLS